MFLCGYCSFDANNKKKFNTFALINYFSHPSINNVRSTT